MTFLPGETSQSTILAVSSHCFVPSGRIVGASTWAPRPSVLAGKAPMEAVIALSIAAWVIVVGVELLPPDMSMPAMVPLDTAAVVRCKVPIMPPSLWPGTSQ